MAKGTDEIKLIDIGLAAEREHTKNIAKSVYVNNQEIEQMTELVNQGVEVIVKQASTDCDVQFTSLIKKGSNNDWTNINWNFFHFANCQLSVFSWNKF